MGQQESSIAVAPKPQNVVKQGTTSMMCNRVKCTVHLHMAGLQWAEAQHSPIVTAAEDGLST
jgi:hypothetical protein